MNKSTKSHNHASEDQPSPIELQLKQMRPRAAQVDLSFLTQAVDQHSQATSSARARAGLTSGQLAASIAASWLFGALIGGGCIFAAMTANDPAVAQNESTQGGEAITIPTSTAQPISTAQPKSPSQPNSLMQTISPNIAATSKTPLPNPNRTSQNIRSDWMFDLDAEFAYSGTPLTVRGLSQRHADRLPSDRYIATSTTQNMSREALTPSSPSSRLQLMQELLSAPSFQIY